jgi:hypothetical protein
VKKTKNPLQRENASPNSTAYTFTPHSKIKGISRPLSPTEKKEKKKKKQTPL